MPQEVENHLQVNTKNSLYTWSPRTGQSYIFPKKGGDIVFGAGAEQKEFDQVVFIRGGRMQRRLRAMIDSGATYRVEQRDGGSWSTAPGPARLNDVLETRLVVTPAPKRVVARIIHAITPAEPIYMDVSTSGLRGDQALFISREKYKSRITSALTSSSGYTDFNPR